MFSLFSRKKKPERPLNASKSSSLKNKDVATRKRPSRQLAPATKSSGNTASAPVPVSTAPKPNYANFINQFEDLTSLSLSVSLSGPMASALDSGSLQTSSEANLRSNLGSNLVVLGPRPPRLNTNQPVISAPSSPVSRRSTDRHVPSYVRHSRVLSGASANLGALDSMFLRAGTLRQRLKTIQTDLPPELLPVINLLNAQRVRQYAEGPLLVLAPNNFDWIPCDAVLTGTELCIWLEGSSNARYLNVQDCSIVPLRASVPGDDMLYDLVVLQDFDTKITTFRFPNSTAMTSWLSGLQLAKFENTSLNEAFTAVMLSLKGPELLDIYTLLAHKKRFPRFEWCNLRLPQVLNKWVRVYMAIIPGDGKKKGRVEVYTLDKINKKSLVLYVNDADAVYNVYPEDYNMINFNLIMKLEGEVFVSKLFQHLFSYESFQPPGTPTMALKMFSRSTSQTSMSSLNPPPAIGLGSSPANGSGARSRSTSVNSTSSFFVNAPLPDPEGNVQSMPGSPTRSGTHFFKKQTANNFVSTNYLYVMPLTHPGVSALEIMIRNFVHIIDAFKLYGRPEHLNSDKLLPVSMLFGLPSLPHCFYLSDEDAYEVVAANFDTARLQNWTELQWRNCLKEYLLCKQRDGDYKGEGNIVELFDSVEAEGADSLDGMGSPKITLPQYGSRVTSPMPPAVPSKLRQSASEQNGFDPFSDSDTNIALRDQVYLGRPIEFESSSYSPRPSRGNIPNHELTNDEVIRSLEPIVDLPTPLDDNVAKHYFAINDDKAVRVGP
ncbi:CIC11C00000005796 [Sungouiella intermedia]|uniref:CIC11C00000005796 n=1 Tax=Sungouiella intermedia TaxID=45354 RepID=A0A1L0B882_9ASCO|nr:CIC11C00000005796 [[Candida] intermedia]